MFVQGGDSYTNLSFPLETQSKQSPTAPPMATKNKQEGHYRNGQKCDMSNVSWGYEITSSRLEI